MTRVLGENVSNFINGPNFLSFNDPVAIFSQMKWTSISKCFDLSWKTGLLAGRIADLLSHKREIGRRMLTFRSFNSF